MASLPAAIAGAGFIGFYAGALTETVPDVWQAALLERIGFDWHRADPLSALIRGGSLWLPLLGISLAVSWLWAMAFARLRRRPVDSGWAVSAWIFSLMLPAAIPLPYAMLGISFGVIFGSHVFGGTGRYIVNPALLGVVFLSIGYPSLFESARWLPGIEQASTWEIASRNPLSVSADQGLAFLPLLLGREIGAIGTGSALACYAGALYLMAAQKASRPMIGAAVAAAAVVAALAGGLPWHWHIVIGQFAFLAAFVATDPTVQARTLPGRLAYGATFGLLTVAIRVGDPAHPEGSWYGLLLAMLCVPLFDHLARLRRAAAHGAVAVPHD